MGFQNRTNLNLPTKLKKSNPKKVQTRLETSETKSLICNSLKTWNSIKNLCNYRVYLKKFL